MKPLTDEWIAKAEGKPIAAQALSICKSLRNEVRAVLIP